MSKEGIDLSHGVGGMRRYGCLCVGVWLSLSLLAGPCRGDHAGITPDPCQQKQLETIVKAYNTVYRYDAADPMSSLETLLSPEAFVVTTNGAVVEGKDQIIQVYRSYRDDILSTCVSFEVNVEPISMVSSGDVAVVFSRVRMSGTLKDQKDYQRDVWQSVVLHQNNQGQWMVEQEHATLAPRLSFSGIGVGIEMRPHGAVVTKVIPGGPAESAGLKTGEVIVTINDENIVDKPLNEVIQLLRGPEGSSVQLGILSMEDDSRMLFVTRAPISIKQD